MNYDMIRKYSTSVLAAALINLETKCVKEVSMITILGRCFDWSEKEGFEENHIRNKRNDR